MGESHLDGGDTVSRLLSVFALLIVIASSLTAAPALGEVTPEELEAAKGELLEVRERVQVLAAAYERALAETERLESAIANAERQQIDLTVELADTAAVASERAVDMYIEGLSDNLPLFVSSGSLADVGTGLVYLRDVGDSDQILLNELAILQRDLDRVTEALAAASAEQVVAVAEMEATAIELNAVLEEAQAEYNTVYAQWQKEEAARQAEIERLRQIEAARTGGGGGAPPVVTSGRTCPVNGVVGFSDTWGAPRSGGRSHRGVDMLAARGTSLVAIETGTVARMGNSGIGGITIWLVGDSGDEFYYAHLDAWASGLSRGDRVTVGTFIGTVGTSGNAPENIPHLHFEYHPNGGGAVNPTPLVSNLCL